MRRKNQSTNNTRKSEFVNRLEAAAYLGYEPVTLSSWAWRHKGPKFYKLGRSVRYKLSDLDEWANKNAVDHEAQAGDR